MRMYDDDGQSISQSINHIKSRLAGCGCPRSIACLYRILLPKAYQLVAADRSSLEPSLPLAVRSFRVEA